MDSSSTTNTLSPEDKKFCTRTLKTLMKHPAGAPFLVPVDPVAFNIPDYFDIIKNPMDLGTIQSKLRISEYDSVDAFVSDMELMFDNCFLYNNPGDPVCMDARVLQEVFQKAMAKYIPEHAKAKTAKTTASSSGRRQIVEKNHENFTAQKMPNDQFRRCEGALKELKKNRDLSWPFEAPVDAEAWGATDYYTVITRPMDLATLKSNLYAHKYTTDAEFEADVRQIFINSHQYNPYDHPVNERARSLEKVFDAYWEKTHDRKAQSKGEQGESKKEKSSSSKQITDQTTTGTQDHQSQSESNDEAPKRSAILRLKLPVKRSEKPSQPSSLLKASTASASSVPMERSKETAPVTPSSSSSTTACPSNSQSSHVSQPRPKLAISKNPPLASTSMPRLAISDIKPASSIGKKRQADTAQLDEDARGNGESSSSKKPSISATHKPQKHITRPPARSPPPPPPANNNPKPVYYDIDNLFDKIHQGHRERAQERREEQERMLRYQREQREKAMKKRQEEQLKRKEWREWANKKRQMERERRVRELSALNVTTNKQKMMLRRFETTQLCKNYDWRDLYNWHRETVDYRHLPKPGFIRRYKGSLDDLRSKLLSAGIRYKKAQADAEPEEGEVEMDVD